MVAPAGPVIIGGGLAGGLLALALRELGAAVTLIDAPSADGAASASAISYGAIPGWPLAPTALARLAATASRRWRRLQSLHGPLGWSPARLGLHGSSSNANSSPALAAWQRLWPLPFARVDSGVFQQRLPAVLAAAGVERIDARLQQLSTASAGGWQLTLADGCRLEARQVVLAAGAGALQLWPSLPRQLRCSWAAVLELPNFPTRLGEPACWLPRRFQRPALERAVAELTEPRWLVDAGLVPWGAGALLGQLSLLRPERLPGPPPPAGQSEERLRQGLAAQGWGAPLAALPGLLRQAPVAFCQQGAPLVGAAPGDGLWLFSGFSGGFSQVPVLAPLLAQCLVAGPGPAAAAERRLRQLGVWPAAGG